MEAGEAELSDDPDRMNTRVYICTVMESTLRDVDSGYVSRVRRVISQLIFNHSSLCSFFRALLASSSFCSRPVDFEWPTASSPPKNLNAVWKVHSTASSTGLSNAYGRNGTADRPSLARVSGLFTDHELDLLLWDPMFER